MSGTGDSDERKFEKEKSCHFLVTHYHSSPNYAFLSTLSSLITPSFRFLSPDFLKSLTGVNGSGKEGRELIFVDPLLCGRLWKHDEIQRGYLTCRHTGACRW